MGLYEYKVVPAPARGTKARGLRKAEDKFALSLQELMNELAAEAWEFLRSETLPNEERSGLTSTATTYRSVLVFRRALEAAQTAPIAAVEAPAEQPQPVAETRAPEPVATEKPAVNAAPTPPANDTYSDDLTDAEAEAAFVEDAAPIAPAKTASALPAALRQRAQLQNSKKDMAAE